MLCCMIVLVLHPSTVCALQSSAPVPLQHLQGTVARLRVMLLPALLNTYPVDRVIQYFHVQSVRGLLPMVSRCFL
jgi:hypothetical protein